MNLLNSPVYQEDLHRIASFPAIPWDQLYGSSILLSGATGMIGRLLVDAIALKNEKDNLHCSVIALGRSTNKAIARFEQYWNSPFFRFVECDINDKSSLPSDIPASFVLHLASNTHPLAYATDPIGTITANIMGTRNMLDLTVNSKAQRFLFASSNEIYGENRGDSELFNESYCGYIDCNTLRAGYPESKRCGEALCQAYKKQKGVDFVIARLTRSFGPTLQTDDTKALSQFLKNAVNDEDIVLKSPGHQYYSYTYAADAVTGLLTLLLKGENGQAYNVADQSCDIQLKDLAQLIAALSGTKVIFQIPSEAESLGYSKSTKARLDSTKLKALGWRVSYTLEEALKRTLTCMKENFI
jgi:nucleoside-diphosphate-sugar epimerase